MVTVVVEVVSVLAKNDCGDVTSTYCCCDGAGDGCSDGIVLLVDMKIMVV